MSANTDTTDQMSNNGAAGPILAPPSSRRHINVTWADKTAMYVAAGWLAALAIGWLMAIVACGVSGANLLARDTAVLAVEAGLALVLPVWFALTGLDILFHGPARRLSRTDKARP
jgi:hypothetical protein